MACTTIGAGAQSCCSQLHNRELPAAQGFSDAPVAQGFSLAPYKANGRDPYAGARPSTLCELLHADA
jgi:hypothetical protein